jgi:hypothetical protein
MRLLASKEGERVMEDGEQKFQSFPNSFGASRKVYDQRSADDSGHAS